MANEHVLVFETDKPIPMTCADGSGIEKGTVVKLADPFTVSASSALNDIIGGVVAEEKVASDGRVKVPVYRGGIFKAVASGSITVGDALVTCTGANLLQTAAVNEEHIIGTALETASNAETFLYELKPTSMQLA